MLKQDRSRATRQRIIESAALMFDRFGYAGTTLSDVVQQGGFTKGSLYFHFSSKEEIARAVVDTQHERSVGPVQAFTRDGMGGLEATIRATHALGRLLLDDVLVRAGIRLTLEQGSLSAVMTRPYEEWIAVTERMLRQAVDEGDMRPGVDPEAVARFLVGSFTGVQVLSGVMTGRQDLMLRLRQLWTILLPGLVPARKVPHFERLNCLLATASTEAVP